MTQTLPKKSVTMLDVARALDVSKATVSLAYTGNGRIAPKTRAMVLQQARAMGFEPNPHAQRLKSRRNDLIGLFTVGLDLTVGTEKIQLLQYRLGEQGYEVPLYSTALGATGARANEIDLIGTLRRQKPRAIVCNNANLRPEVVSELQNYVEEGGTLVCYDQQPRVENQALRCDTVIFDREDETYQGVRHLLELGHRDIGLMNHGSKTTPRLRGFHRALNEWDVEAREEWVLSDGDYRTGSPELADKFLRMRERPTGLYIINDLVAAVFINQVQRAGLKVPDDVSVISHGGRPFGKFSAVPLSTTTHPIEAIVAAVVERLANRLDADDSAPQQKWVRAELIVRESTRAPRAGSTI